MRKTTVRFGSLIFLLVGTVAFGQEAVTDPTAENDLSNIENALTTPPESGAVGSAAFPSVGSSVGGYSGNGSTVQETLNAEMFNPSSTYLGSQLQVPTVSSSTELYVTLPMVLGGVNVGPTFSSFGSNITNTALGSALNGFRVVARSALAMVLYIGLAVRIVSVLRQ